MNLFFETKSVKKKDASIMQSEWRLLKDEIFEARHHFAMEEALARLLDEGHSSPTLRLRRVHPAVFVGVHQNTASEVDIDYCRAHGIQIVRRMNGGGAVYQEMGSFCFSAFFRLSTFGVSEIELYRYFADPVIRTCADYGVSAHFGGRNDVLVGDRKIYGSAQFSCYQAFVQSGTFLVNMNFDTMEKALTPSKLKFIGKSAQSIRERVTSLSDEAGREIDTLEVMDRLAYHISNSLGIHLTPGFFTPAEQELAAELLKVKYSTDQWNFGSQLEFQITVAERTGEGILSLSADIEGSIIRKIQITGDILLSQKEIFEELEQLIAGHSLRDAHQVVRKATLPIFLQNSIIRLLDKLSREITAVSSMRTTEE